MSYCRMGWDGSDVYVIGSTHEGKDAIECVGCRLPGNVSVDRERNEHGAVMPKEILAINHLAMHKVLGHYVPFDAIQKLWQEIPGPNEAVNPEPDAIKKAHDTIKRMMAEGEGHS